MQGGFWCACAASRHLDTLSAIVIVAMMVVKVGTGDSCRCFECRCAAALPPALCWDLHYDGDGGSATCVLVLCSVAATRHLDAVLAIDAVAMMVMKVETHGGITISMKPKD